MIGQRKLLGLGVALVALGLFGASLTPGWGGFGGMWGMHGWMHGPGSYGSGSAVPAPPVEGATEVTVVADDFSFSPSRIQVEGPFNLTLVNAGRLLHDITIPELNVQLVAGPGETVTTGVSQVQPGEYSFFCSVPGHADAGMVGVVEVESS
ncbi:MAG: cupredoxin domain-containing protein [Acidimicrobiia bacterium]